MNEMGEFFQGIDNARTWTTGQVYIHFVQSIIKAGISILQPLLSSHELSRQILAAPHADPGNHYLWVGLNNCL